MPGTVRPLNTASQLFLGVASAAGEIDQTAHPCVRGWRAQNKMPNYYFATVTLHRQTSLDRMIDDAMAGNANVTPTSTNSSAG